METTAPTIKNPLKEVLLLVKAKVNPEKGRAKVVSLKVKVSFVHVRAKEKAKASMAKAEPPSTNPNRMSRGIGTPLLTGLTPANLGTPVRSRLLLLPALPRPLTLLITLRPLLLATVGSCPAWLLGKETRTLLFLLVFELTLAVRAGPLSILTLMVILLGM